MAPGGSNIEAGRTCCTISRAAELMQCVRGKNVIAGDVVCLKPTKDNPNKITSMVAVAVLFEIVRLTADRIRSG